MGWKRQLRAGSIRCRYTTPFAQAKSHSDYHWPEPSGFKFARDLHISVFDSDVPRVPLLVFKRSYFGCYEWLWQNLTVCVKAHYPMKCTRNRQKNAHCLQKCLYWMCARTCTNRRPERSAPFSRFAALPPQSIHESLHVSVTRAIAEAA